MTYTDLVSFYEKRKAEFSAQLSEVNRKINFVANTRIAAALAFIVSLYLAFDLSFWLYVAALLLVLFIALVQRHTNLYSQKTHLENLVMLNGGERQAIQGDHSFFSKGNEFIDPHHPYTHDLDIFGEGSLFQSINRCNTLNGKRTFATRLRGALPSKKSIQQHQEACAELSAKTDFRQHLQAAGMEMNEQPGDHAQLVEWTNHPSFLFGKPLFKYLLVILPVVVIALVIGAFFFPQLKSFAIAGVLLHWVFLGVYSKKVSAFHEYISRKKNILEKYAHLLTYLRHEKFESELMKGFASTAYEADRKVKSLASLVSALNARLNFMTNVVVNSLLMYDLQCVYRLEKWKEENGKNLIAWLTAISDTEVLACLGTYQFNHPDFCFAEIHDSLLINAKDLGHPMLQSNARITNDVKVGENQSVLIITGANMAGKSTFLRTLGVNLVLALNGAPVCATEFRCPIISLRTGMRTADSLKDHQSYFYAELDRLKTIMDELRSDKPLFILLDEILKGTNSTDKQTGSIALVKQLLPHPCLALIATHDLALGELAQQHPHRVANFCFEPTIENDQLSFDYKLKSGLAQKMNATFLMKKMGIIPA